MTRHIDWQNRLTDLIVENRSKPFDFVSHNCLLWAGQSILAVTGSNPVSRVVGQYDDEKSALRYLKKVEGVTSVSQFLMKVIEQEDSAIAFARPGDIVLADPSNVEVVEIPCGDKFGKVPGVCYGQLSYFVGLDGLVDIETSRLDSAICLL